MNIREQNGDSLAALEGCAGVGGRVSVNGNRLWLRVRGEGLPLIVQCPGWGTGCQYLEETLTPLERDCRIYYCDSRGSGRSETPADSTHLTVGHIVWDVEALRGLTDLKKFVLFGHSHGAFVALNYAMRHPTHVAGLILVSPQVGTREVVHDLRRNLPRLARQPKYSAAAARWNAGRVARTDTALGAWLRDVFDLYFVDPQIGQDWWPRLHFDEIATTAWLNVTASNDFYDVRERLHDVAVPMLIVVGRHDFITSPDQASIIQRACPQAEMLVARQSGHFPWLEEPRVVFGAIRRFIRRVKPQCDFKGG